MSHTHELPFTFRSQCHARRRLHALEQLRDARDATFTAELDWTSAVTSERERPRRFVSLL